MTTQPAVPSPSVAELLERLNATFPRLGTDVTDAAEARARLRQLRPPLTSPTPVAWVRDESIAGPEGAEIAVRRYRPRTVAASAVLLFLHGGGFVIGDLDSHDELARRLALAGDVEVLSVDYRRAPEHRHPAALEDAAAALEHVAGEAAGRPVLVAGDSAGGNLAAALALMARDAGSASIAGQLLLYPMLDDRRDTPSYRENAHGRYITADHLRWFWEQYHPSPDPGPLAAPARATDLRGLPPAHVVTAGLDPLRDEGEAYAAALASAGVPVAVRRYDDAFHGFLAFPDQLEVARRAMSEIGAAIAALRGSAR